MGTDRSLFRIATLAATAAIVFAACGGGASTSPSESASESASASASASESASADPMAALIEAAKAEGTLTTIALPDDWCNYREMIDTFKAKYGLMVNELDPNAGSNDELEAIKANKDGGANAPDVVDVGLSFGPQAKSEGLLDRKSTRLNSSH